MATNGLRYGTDPEVALVVKATGRIRDAHDIVSDPHKANAIGVDGNRPTASIEFRPGISESSEDLVNRLGDLTTQLAEHYPNPQTYFKAGAWIDVEPLGGHIHVAWAPNVTITDAAFCDVLSGLHTYTDFLHDAAFDSHELRTRSHYANTYNRDFGKPLSYRAGAHNDDHHTSGMCCKLANVLATRHFEYRYAASWMLTPELAYCFLGGAEVIVQRAFLDRQVVRPRNWTKFVYRMYHDRGLCPRSGGPSLAQAFQVAMRYRNWNEDYTQHWKG